MTELSENSSFHNPKMKQRTMDPDERSRMKEEQGMMKMQILKARKAVKVLTGAEAEKVCYKDIFIVIISLLAL